MGRRQFPVHQRRQLGALRRDGPDGAGRRYQRHYDDDGAWTANDYCNVHRPNGRASGVHHLWCRSCHRAGGFDVPATFVSVDVNSDGTPRIATFSITPPGGIGMPATMAFTTLCYSPGWSPMSSAMLWRAEPSVLYVNVAARVLGIQVNDGSAQRSMVTSLKITFDQNVTLPADLARPSS